MNNEKMKKEIEAHQDISKQHEVRVYNQK